MCFWLGAPHATYLARTDAPLFISRRTLETRKKFPRALGRWALDSGAFTEITKHGRWMLSALDYALLVRRFLTEIGGMAWAAIQDWMCEPHMLALTGLTIREHQARTVQSLLDLRSIAPDLPWVPVLQGWVEADYLRHADDYATAGIDLTHEPLVGIGSVCRRQNTEEIACVLSRVAGLGIKLHGFGVKSSGLVRAEASLVSADSMAWSKRAMKIGVPAMPECVGGPHKNCACCLRFALHWRRALLDRLPERWDGGVATPIYLEGARASARQAPC